MRANFVLSEVAIGLRRNITMTLAMIITTAISLGMLGAGLLIYRQVNDMKDYFYFKLEVSIFLQKDVTQSQRDTLRRELTSDPLVRSVVYESKEDAYRRFQEQFKDSPDLVNNVRPSALPESFRVKLRDPKQYDRAATEYRAQQGVDEVVDQRKILGKLFAILGGFQTAALVLAAMQGLAALLLIGNTIQVAAFSRRRETGIMKLVGASNWYVQLPFVIEAAVAGMIGALLAVGGLIGTKLVFVDGTLKALFQSGVIPTISWHSIVLVSLPLALVSVLLASIAAWVTLRFYVRV